MKKRQRSLSIPGVSLLLLIFLTLCLITFSLLSLSGASADENLSRKAADRTLSYYKADSSANDILAQTNEYLAGYLREAEESSDPKARYQELCADLPSADSVYTLEDSTLSFSVSVNDDQILQVQLELTYPEEPDDTLYRITSWKIVNTREWTPDTHLNLYSPVQIIN